MFSQLAKRSARLLPANLCTDHVHYVKNNRSTVLRRNKNMTVEGGTVSHYYIFGNSQFYCQILCRFSDSVWFSFSVQQFSSAEFGICKIQLRIADKNRRRVDHELSNSVLLQTLGKLKSIHGTELSVVVVICLLGSF